MKRQEKPEIVLEGIVTKNPEKLDGEIRIPFKYTNIKTIGFRKQPPSHFIPTINRVTKIRLKTPYQENIPIIKNTRITAHYLEFYDDSNSISENPSQFLYADSIGIIDENSNKEFVTYHVIK